MDLSYLDFPLPPKTPSRSQETTAAEDMAAIQPFQEPLLFSDDVFDIDGMPDDFYQFQNAPEQFYWMGPAPQPPPKHPGRAKRYSELFQRKTRRATSIMSAGSDISAHVEVASQTSFATPSGVDSAEIVALSPVPSLTYGHSSSSSTSSISSDEIPTPSSTASGYWTAEEKDFFTFTGTVTQRSRAASKCSERKPSLTIPAASIPAAHEIESPIIPKDFPPIVFQTPTRESSPAKQISTPPKRAATLKRRDSTRSSAPSIASSEESTNRVEAIVINTRATLPSPRQLRRRPAIPAHANLRQLRAEQSEACLKEAYSRHVDAYLDGTTALKAFGI